MRWDGQKTEAEQQSMLPGLALTGHVRTVRPPEFAGVTFHEVHARSALNKVSESSRMPFRWTVNPMRGCLHACAYCFARPSHEYLGLDAGRDFETQIVVKTNIVEVLTAELRRPSWRGEAVALGTNTDPYQRAEGRYGLMPGLIGALADAGTPVSVLTKGTLLRRDLPVLSEAAERVPVSLAVSLAIGAEDLQQSLEPGTPTPRARLALVRAVREAGLDCGVMVAPVLPWLTDAVPHLDALFHDLAEAGASWVSVFPLHLRGPVRPLMLAWLSAHRPDLVGPYRELYRGAYVPKEYTRWLQARVAPLLRGHGLRTPPEVDGTGRWRRSAGAGERAGAGAGRARGAQGQPAGSTPVDPQSGVLQPALF